MGKLAEEVNLLRQEMKDSKNTISPTQASCSFVVCSCFRTAHGKEYEMANTIVSFLAPGPIELFVILIVLGVPVVLVVLIVLLVRYALRASTESRRLRLEVGKLADELEQMRKRPKNAEKPDVLSPSQ
jgi:Flp pilus assembly protein TadB